MNKFWSFYIDVIFYIIIIQLSISIIGFNKNLYYWVIFCTYFLLSRFFFLSIFVPKIFELIKFIMQDEKVLVKLRFRNNHLFEVRFLFNTYMEYQRNINKFKKKIINYSYFAFIFMPLLIFIYFRLNRIKNLK